jgi:cysteine desulfurase
VLQAAQRLAEAGRIDLELLSVSPSGHVDPDELEDLLRHCDFHPSATLVSIIAGNNETGVIQRIPELGAVTTAAGVVFHVDATQCLGRIPVRIGAGEGAWPVDLLTLSSHKIGGPRGAGALYVRRAIGLDAVLNGGHQERDRRAGTEDTAAIAGFAAAALEAVTQVGSEAGRLLELRHRLRDGILGQIDGAGVVARRAPRLPNTLAVYFDGCRGEDLLVALDLAGIAVSSGSACSSGSLEPSPVLLAMGLDEERARSVVRFSLGWTTQVYDIEVVLRRLPAMVARAREAEADV